VTDVDIAGHFAYASLFAGQLLLTRKNRYGWALRFVGEAGWLAIGLYMGMSSIWSWGALFLIIDCVGFYRWRRDGHQDE
jgi:hypothetical protein